MRYSWHLGWNTVKIPIAMKKILIHVAPVPKDFQLKWIASIVYVSLTTAVAWMPESVFTLLHLTHVRYAGGFDFLMSSLILMIMDNGNWHCGSPEMQGSQSKQHRNENWKTYIINQIQICAEYWDIVPKALTDLSCMSNSKLTNLPRPWVTLPVFCTDFHLYNKTYVGYIFEHTCPAPLVDSFIGSVFQHTSWSVLLSVYVVWLDWYLYLLTPGLF